MSAAELIYLQDRGRDEPALVIREHLVTSKGVGKDGKAFELRYVAVVVTTEKESNDE